MLADGRLDHQAEWLTERTGTVHVSCQPGHCLEGLHIAYAREQHLGAEQGEEPIRSRAAARLGKVLQADERQQPLAATFAHHPRQVGQRRHVCHFVEHERHRHAQGPGGRCPVSGGAHLFQEGHHDRRHKCLVPGRRADVDRARAVGELVGVKVRVLGQL